MIRMAFLLALAALAGCAPPAPEPMPIRDALQQTIVPLCGGTHSAAVASGNAVAQVRSECKPTTRPQ